MRKGNYKWLTHNVIYQTNDAVTIMFNTRRSVFHYEPGQFINLSFVVNGERLTRSYSLSSSPDIDPYISITVKRVSKGRMSNYIVDSADRIQEWEIEGPYGSFVLNKVSLNSKHFVLLAGGSGITPIWSIAKSILKRSSNTSLTLLYANRHWNDVIFANEIDTLTQKYKDRLVVFHALSESEKINPLSPCNHIEGRLSKLIIRKILKQATVNAIPEAHFFICAPSGLMQLYQQTLEGLEVPKTNVFMERFIEETEPFERAGLPEMMREVLVHFYEQTHLIEVQPGNTILTACLQNGISLRHSCHSGTCGTCAAMLIAGKVNMLKNYALTAAEVAGGAILLCQSYPLDDEVTIGIG